jgi:hypothetical protein
MLGSRRADTTGTPLSDDLAPGDLGAVDGHDRHHRHARVGQDYGGLVGLERDGLQGRGEAVAAMPQSPGWVELKATAILLGVDRDHPAGADGQVDAPMVVNLR